MNLSQPRGVTRYIGLALITASVLALQVIFTRIFSIMIWHHFTYLVIGIAMLGGGASGVFLAVRRWNSATIERRLGRLSAAFSASILLNLLIMNSVGIDPLRGSQIVQTLIGLAIYFAGLFTTFFLGGLAIACIFSLWVGSAHRLYFADMLGAGVSTLAVVWVLQAIGGPAAIVLVALMALAAAAIFDVGGGLAGRLALGGFGTGQAALFGWVLAAAPIQLPVPESKELGWAQRAFEHRPEYTRWNPSGRVDVLPQIEVKEPMIVGGISGAYLESETFQNGAPYPLKLVTIDGTSMTGMYAFDGTEEDLQRFRFLDHAIISAAYHLGAEKPSTLLIGVGGGLDILLARLYGASSITAIDLNSDIVQLLKGPYREYSGGLADHPNTTVVAAEGRSFMTRDTRQYDIVQGIGLDNLVALSGGAYVLAESYIYTVESFDLALDRLTPQGVFSWTRNVDTPAREMLRITGLAAEALRQRGVSDPAAHIAIVANDSGSMATLLVAREPFSPESIARLNAWAEGNRFTFLHNPIERVDTVYAEYLYAADPRAFEENYSFNIFPVTDDRPFFYNYFKWSNLEFNSEFSGKLNRFPIGNLILLAMFAFSTIAAVAFIVAPLMRHKSDGLHTPNALPTLAYFSALGIGYIFVQIILIQRFTLFIGYPTTAIATTIFSMLIFSAVGSLISQRIVTTAGRLRIALLAVCAAVFAYIAVLPPIFSALLMLPDSVRMAISVLLIAPLALLMGMPFPTGLRQIGERAPAMVPWAWGLNGVFSVVGSTLVIIVSMSTSFTVAMASAVLFYGLAAAVAPALWRPAIAAAREPVAVGDAALAK
jgi:hypothetical protein